MKSRRKNVTGYKWVYCKNDALSEKESKKYFAWLVIKGYSHWSGIYYILIFSLIVKQTSFRVIQLSGAMHVMGLEQLDVKTTCFHENSEGKIYMQQGEGLKGLGKEEYIFL